MRARWVATTVWVAVSACGTADQETDQTQSEGMAGYEGIADARVVEVVGEGVVSTSESQTFPSEDPVTGDLWFSVMGDSFDNQTVMVARRTEQGWAPPEIAPFSGEWGDRAPLPDDLGFQAMLAEVKVRWEAVVDWEAGL